MPHLIHLRFMYNPYRKRKPTEDDIGGISRRVRIDEASSKGTDHIGICEQRWYHDDNEYPSKEDGNCNQ